MELQQGLQFLNNKVLKTEQVENNSNFDFNNDGVDTDNNKFNMGKTTNKIMNTITDFMGINSLEGFQQNTKNLPVYKKNKDELANLRRLENTLSRLISQYSTIHKQLMNNTKGYLESSEGANKYSGKNINLPS